MCIRDSLNFHIADLETLDTHPTTPRKEIGLDSVHSDSWKWFNGDLNKYYNQLIASDSKRNPNDIKTYAVLFIVGWEKIDQL